MTATCNQLLTSGIVFVCQHGRACPQYGIFCLKTYESMAGHLVSHPAQHSLVQAGEVTHARASLMSQVDTTSQQTW